MVKHWAREMAGARGRDRRRMRRAQGVNLVGAVATATVLVIVIATKVEHGAWIAILAMIGLFALMKGINRHYCNVRRELDASQAGPQAAPAHNIAMVLVSRLHLPTLRALAYANSTRPSSIEAVTVDVDAADTEHLLEEWERRGIEIPLKILDSPYREITKPIVDHVRDGQAQQPTRCDHGVRPGVRGGSVVGEPLAQPERPAVEDPAALHAGGHGGQRPVAVAVVRG